MFARVTTIEGPPGSVDEGIIAMREKALPMARQMAGFKGLLSLVDRGTGKGLTVTLWESESAMKESEKAADEIRSEAVGAIGGATVASVERYEVALDER